ncbi:cysteine dioxygenase [Acrasis kona]|uniref:Cysteine dioxygenase n=1 Tax=Acrasis kona TaxID=1008807 RepID=A0AAW2YQP9_9EUKA
MNDIFSPGFREFSSQLLTAFCKGTEHNVVDKSEVIHLFEKFVDNNFETIQKYAYVDPTKNYTRNLILENEHFSLMVLCWNPYAKSCIHAHGGSQCWLRVLKGQVKECLWDCDPYKESKINTPPHRVSFANPNDVLYIDDNKGVHCIENLENPTITLHCYAPPYKSSKCFDASTGAEFIGSSIFDSESLLLKNPNLSPFEEIYGGDEVMEDAGCGCDDYGKDCSCGH